MIEQYTSPAVVNNSQEPWLVGEGVSLSGSIAIPSLDFNFVTNAFPGTVTFTRASSATFFNSAGVLTSAAINVPRLDYDPGTLAARGFLVEEQRTNLLVQSELASGWTLSAVTRTANATSAPDGTFTANFYTSTGADSSVAQLAVAVSASITYTFSIWLRADVATTVNIFIVDTGGGAGNTGAVCNVTTQWTRFVVTRTTSAGTTSCTAQVGGANTFSTGEAVYVWGAQLEAGAFSTSYIPTTTTALTRSADVASVNTLSPWFNATEGTLYAESSRFALGSSGQLIVAEFGSTLNNNDNIIQLGTQFATTSFQFLVNTGGVNQVALVEAGTTAVAKYAAAYKVNDFAYTKNGAAPLTDASGSVPTVVQLNIGSRPAFGNTGFLNGYIRRIVYYPRRLSNAELQSITS